MVRPYGFRLSIQGGVSVVKLAFRAVSQSWKDVGFLEYLLLFLGKTYGINEILRASLSISAAAALIAAIFARETLGSAKTLVLSAKQTSL